MVSRLEYEDSVTHGAAKAACYRPCVTQILGGMSGRIMGGKVRLVLGWICGRIFSWYKKKKNCGAGGVQWKFSRALNGSELRAIEV